MMLDGNTAVIDNDFVSHASLQGFVFIISNVLRQINILPAFTALSSDANETAESGVYCAVSVQQPRFAW